MSVLHIYPQYSNDGITGAQVLEVAFHWVENGLEKEKVGSLETERWKEMTWVILPHVQGLDRVRSETIVNITAIVNMRL